MQYAKPEALVETDWLAARLHDQTIRIVDASWHMPAAKRSGAAEYAECHIPGAVYWDIDAIADPDDPLPHMAPGADSFAGHMARLGIADGTQVVVYDATGIGTAPRAWWMLRYFGHDDVAVLNGGLKKWLAEGRPVDVAPAAERTGGFTPRQRPSLIRDLAGMRANVDTAAEQVLDARSAGRYAGTDPEPRAGLRGGHIPGSLSLPAAELVEPETGTMRPADTLAERFAGAGVDLARPTATSCGSGVSACVLALGLHLLGHEGVAVYDGSWTEWGGRDDTPIEAR